MKILGIIPARSGSKGIPHKNIYLCAGEPLIEWTIKAVVDSNLDNYIISTDSDMLLRTYIQAKSRPSFLCNDNAKTIDVIKYHAEQSCFIDYDAFMILQPTSPLRTADDINEAIYLFESPGVNSLFSGYYMGIKHKDKLYDKHTVEKHFQRNGAIFIAKRELIEQGILWDNSVIEYEMPLSRSIDIDNLDNMYIAEALLEKRLREVKNP